MSARAWLILCLLGPALLALASFAADGAPAPDPTAPAQVRGVYAFTDVTLIPMDRERAVPGRTVIVRDGLIVEVGEAGEVEVPAGATVISGRGRYLMPGLAEMHAHVPPGQDPPREAIEETLFLYVANGITTIRGMLGAPYQLELREQIRRGQVLGPTFYVGAPSIRGGQLTPEDVERQVRAHAAAGYDFLKIHPGVPRESWDRMVEVAREVGITYGGHVPADVGIHHAVETGMSAIDHLDGFLQATRLDGVETSSRAELYRATDHEKLDALAVKLAEHNVWQVPTQYLWNHLNGYVDADSLLALPEFRYISRQLRESYRTRAERNRQNPQITPEVDRAHREMRQEFLSAAHRAGAPILMGTDSPQLFNVPGFALHREIPLMEDAGMTPYEVLLSGTRNVAEFVERTLGQEGNFGTIRAGTRADLLLLEANPLERLDALQRRAGVMVAGQWLSADEIDARLEVIAARYGGE